MADPEFTVTLVVDGNWGAYERFIGTVRSLAADPEAPICSGGAFQLPRESEQEVSRQRWFEVVLRTNQAEIRLRIRRETLYLDAYQRPDGTWVEYVSECPRLYPDSNILDDCDGGYPQLQRGTPGRANIGLDLDQLEHAVNMLAVQDGRETRTYQIIVIQMICESLRLECITQYLIAGHGSGGAPAWMIGREGSWRRLSRILLVHSADHFQTFEFNEAFTRETEIRQISDVIRSLGLVKPPNASDDHLRIADGMQESHFFGGGPKVEVYEFRIDSIEEIITPAQLYGAITGEAVFTQDFYKRERDNPEEVSAGDFPLLTGPAVEAMSACDPFSIEVELSAFSIKDELLHKNNYGPITIGKGRIDWNVYNLTSENKYDEFIQKVFPGDKGSSVTFRYAVFRDAVLATIKVKLIRGDQEDPVNLYGNISAVCTRIAVGESMLFRRGTSNHIDVRPGQFIPLSKSIVAVPIYGQLLVRARLWDHDVWSFDDEIAYGTAKFEPRRYGSNTQKIEGIYGEVEVEVTWSI